MGQMAMQILRSGLKVFSARAGGSLVTFAGLIYFARVVNPAELGVFFLFQALVGVLTIPANMGTRLAVEKRISEGTHKNAYLSTGLLMKLALLTLLALALLALREYTTAYLGADLTPFLIAAVTLRELADLFIGAIRGELRVGDTAPIKLAKPVTWVGLGAILATFGYGLPGLATAVVVSYGLQLVWAVWRCSISLGRPRITFAYSLASYGVYSVIPSAEGQIHNWMDILLLGVFMNPAAVAAYEIAWRVADALLTLIQSIGETIFPQISSWSEQGSTEELERLLRDAMTPALLLTIPAIAGAWLLAGDILSTLFGPDYIIAATAFVVIVASKTPRAIREVVGKGLLGTDHPNLLTYAACVDMASNLVLNIILIQQFGLVGAALGTTFSLILGTAVRWWFLSRYVRVGIDYQLVGWAVGATAGMVIVLWPLAAFVEISNAAVLFGLIGAGVLAYGSIIALNETVRTQAHSTLRSFAP